MFRESKRMDIGPWVKLWKKEIDGGNASVAGFYAERAVLATLARGHVSDIDSSFEKLHIGGPFCTKTFEATPEFPLHDTANNPILWIPNNYNYNAVDAVLAVKYKANRDQKKANGNATYMARLYAFQITIAKQHADSNAEFLYEGEGEWISRMLGTNGDTALESVKFVWIRHVGVEIKKTKLPVKTTPYTREVVEVNIDTYVPNDLEG